MDTKYFPLKYVKRGTKCPNCGKKSTIQESVQVLDIHKVPRYAWARKCYACGMIYLTNEEMPKLDASIPYEDDGAVVTKESKNSRKYIGLSLERSTCILDSRNTQPHRIKGQEK